jgi:hypothetical protein
VRANGDERSDIGPSRRGGYRDYRASGDIGHGQFAHGSGQTDTDRGAGRC